MNKRSNTVSVTARDSSELAGVLGLEPADAVTMEFRARLNQKIVTLARTKRFTHVEIAKRAGASRTRITAILNGHTVGVSTDFLLRVLYAMGSRTTPTFSQVKPAA